MKREEPVCVQVDISSDEEDKDPVEKFSGKDPMEKFFGTVFAEPANVAVSKDPFIIRAESYQEYMKQIPIPSLRGSVVPFNSWTELGMSLKELYKQPLHYLTNIHLRRLDQIRIGSPDEDVPLDTIMVPLKAEASIWLMEEVHRLSSSPSYLAELWRNDPFYHICVDSIFPDLQQKSSR